MHQELFWETSLYCFLWLFLIYSFLGWCAEVSAHAVTKGKFINRGFLNGPYCPIYGFGMVLVVICLTPIADNIFLLFLGSVVLTTVLEFVTGFILEKLFKIRWWDYSNQKFNIGGYICLKYSILWGAACVFIMKVIHPLLMDFIGIIPQVLGMIIIGILILGMLADFITVIISLSSISKRMKNMTKISEKLHDGSDKIGSKIAEEVIELQDKLEELPDKKSAIQKRLEKAYPSLEKLDKNISKGELKDLLKKKIEKGQTELKSSIDKSAKDKLEDLKEKKK